MQRSLFQPQTQRSRIQVDPRFVDRPYQADAVRGAFAAFDRGDRGCIVRAFTGAGKTFMGARIAAEWLNRGSKRRVFVCAHERQLVSQFRDELAGFLQMPVALEMATDGKVDHMAEMPLITVSCRASLGLDAKTNTSRLFKFDPEKYEWLLVIDEGHRWAYSLKQCKHILTWFDRSDANRRLLLTATPERSDGLSLKRLAPAIALDYPMFSHNGPSAVEDGWAVPFDQKFIHVTGVDFKNLREVAGDFKADELDKVLREQEQLAAMIVPLLDLVDERRTLIFNAGVEQAKEVARAINAERDRLIAEGADKIPGRAEWLDGSVQDTQRQDVFERHQRGEFQFLSVCGLCREGYNDPGIGCVAIFRPTKSRGLAEQMIGRGCRPLRGCVDGIETAEQRRAAIAASAKPNCMIVDLVGATGLGGCATTAALYAIGQDDIPPDELTARANQELLDSEGGDIGEAVKRAREKILEEKAEAERRALAKARRRARIRTDVKYEVSDTIAARSEVQGGAEPATSKQVWKLGTLGVPRIVAESYSKKQASAVITDLSGGGGGRKPKASLFDKLASEIWG